MTNPILEVALDLAAAGYSVLPIRADGSKAPALREWRTYLTRQPTIDELHAWFDQPGHGLGIVQGAVSGGAELVELEGRAAHHLPALRQLADDTGLGDLWTRVTTGWAETSPSGGWHFHYRLADAPVPGNTKIARRPATTDELDAWKQSETEKAQQLDEPARTQRLARIDQTTPAQVPQVLAETRGEGGQVVAHPTPGTMHPSGRPWQRLLGGPRTAATITLAERDALHALLATLDETPTPTHEPEQAPASAPAPRTPTGQHDGLTPGDDYEAKVDWADILTPHGWTHVTTQGHTRYWLRPGGSDTGARWSASTGRDPERDRLYVFSSSTDFELEVPYTKLGALAVLEYGGDHSAAARALARAGYGSRPAETTLRLLPARNDLTGLLPPPTTDGATALDTSPKPHHDPAPASIIEHRMTLTDVGNSHLLVAKHSHHIRYVARRDEWLIWDGARWAPDNIGHVHELAKQTILDIDPDSSDAAAKHRTRSLSRRAIEAMVALTRTDPNIAVLPQQLDAHPYHLCTPGGVVNLRTGELDPADPADLHTRITTTAPNRDQPTPRWDHFLEQTFLGQAEVVEFVQRLAGYSALGVVTRHVLPFLIGPGGNGKSVFLDVLRAILGDYAATTPAKFLMAGLNQHETEIARLSGLRLVISSEVNEEDRFDEAKVKLLTGGDALTARFMHQNHFTFDPTHTLWLMGNHQPRVSSGGDSFWRRLRLVNFKNTVPPEERIEGLDKLLVEEEAPGILAWIVQGAVDFLRDGLREPAAVMAATNLYASEEDHLARFIEDRVHLGGDKRAREATANIRHAYEQWCRDQGEKPVSPQVLGRELRTRYQVQQSRSHGVRYYTGLTLLADENEPDQPEEWWNK